MTDERFPSPGVDERFPSPGVDIEHGGYPVDARFPEPGTDTRFQGGYSSGPIGIIPPTVDPDIAGSGMEYKVGVTYTLSGANANPSGGGAVAIRYFWVLDGVVLPEKATYQPVDADYGKPLSWRVEYEETGGSNDGTTLRTGGASLVTDVVPVAAGALPDVNFTIGSGTGTVDASVDFTGLQLMYSLVTAPSGTTIDGATGIVSHPTALAYSGTVVVRAANLDGFADTAYEVQVSVSQNFVIEVLTTAPDQSVVIGMRSGGVYNATIEDDTGTDTGITSHDDPAWTRVFPSAGTHLIEISGTAHGPLLRDPAIRRVLNIGNLNWVRMQEAFATCPELTHIIAGTFADFSAVTGNYFGFAKQCPELVSVDLTGVVWGSRTNLQSIFAGCPKLTEVLGNAEMYNGATPTRGDEAFQGSALISGIDPSGCDVSQFTDFGNYSGGFFNFLSGGATLTTAVWDQCLVNWAAQDFTKGVMIDVQGTMPTVSDEVVMTARTKLVNGDFTQSGGFKIEDGISTHPALPAAPNLVISGSTTAYVELPALPFSDLPISSDAIRWRLDGGAWTEVPDYVSGTPITGLTPGAVMEAEYRASSFLGDGPWSDPDVETLLQDGEFSVENVGEQPVVTMDEGVFSFDITGGPFDGVDYDTDYLGNPLDAANFDNSFEWVEIHQVSMDGVNVGDAYAIRPGLILVEGPDPGNQRWDLFRNGVIVPGRGQTVGQIEQADTGTDIVWREYFVDRFVDTAPVSIPVQSGAPDAFVDGDWSLADGGDGTLIATITNLPADNGDAVTHVIYTIDGLNPVEVLVGTPTFQIQTAQIPTGAPKDMVLFAKNSTATSAASDTKSEATTDVPGDWNNTDDDGYSFTTGVSPGSFIYNLNEVPANNGKAITDTLFDLDGDGVWRSTGLIEPGGIEITHPDMDPATTYSIRLVARNPNGDNDPSEPRDVTTFEDAALTIIAPQASKQGFNGATGLQVTTSGSDGVMHMGIYPEADTPDGDDIIAGTGAVSSLSLAVSAAGAVVFPSITDELRMNRGYRAHYIHVAANSDRSNIAFTAPFTTDEWTPASLGASLLNHWDYSVVANVNSNGSEEVTLVVDAVGGKNLGQGTGNRPLYDYEGNIDPANVDNCNQNGLPCAYVPDTSTERAMRSTAVVAPKSGGVTTWVHSFVVQEDCLSVSSPCSIGKGGAQDMWAAADNTGDWHGALNVADGTDIDASASPNYEGPYTGPLAQSYKVNRDTTVTEYFINGKSMGLGVADDTWAETGNTVMFGSKRVVEAFKHKTCEMFISEGSGDIQAQNVNHYFEDKWVP